MNKKPEQKIGLHKFVATGGKPKDYQGSIVKKEKPKK